MKRYVSVVMVSIIAMFFILGGINMSIHSDYFTILRYLITVISAYSAYVAFRGKKEGWGFLLIGVALLFNPIVPARLLKETWVVLDWFVVTVFLINIFILIPRVKKSIKKSESDKKAEGAQL